MASETLEVTTPAAADAPPPSPPMPPTEETPEEIEARLQRTQQALAGKLDVLEQQTLGTIRDTLGAVTDTVNTVQNVVNDPVAAVQSAVMNPISDIADGVSTSVTDMVQNLDPTDLIRKHPFEAVGVAVAGGVVVGMLLSSRAPVVTPGARPTLLQTITGGVREELATLGRQLFDTLSKSLLERVKQSVNIPLPPPPSRM